MQRQVPSISAYVIIQRPKDGRFLVVERQLRGQKVFDLPGGERKHGEKWAETVTRVVSEKLAVDFDL